MSAGCADSADRTPLFEAFSMFTSLYVYPLCEARDHHYYDSDLLKPYKPAVGEAISDFLHRFDLLHRLTGCSERSSSSKCPISAPREQAPARVHKVDARVNLRYGMQSRGCEKDITEAIQFER